MNVRHATKADAPALVSLYHAFFTEDGIETTPGKIAENLEQMIADPRAAIYIAHDGARIAGFATISLTFGVEFGWTAELEDLYLQPPYRGQGWAARLLATAEDWAKGQGATEVFLVITPKAEEDQSLTSFYRRLGFQDSHRITMFRRVKGTVGFAQNT